MIMHTTAVVFDLPLYVVVACDRLDAPVYRSASFRRAQRLGESEE
jgi:hypothetical protein